MVIVTGLSHFFFLVLNWVPNIKVLGQDPEVKLDLTKPIKILYISECCSVLALRGWALKCNCKKRSFKHFVENYLLAYLFLKHKNEENQKKLGTKPIVHKLSCKMKLNRRARKQEVQAVPHQNGNFISPAWVSLHWDSHHIFPHMHLQPLAIVLEYEGEFFHDVQ